MQKGLIIKNITNKYYIKSEEVIYEAVARGKFKQEEVTPTVGDNVEIEITDEQNKKAIIEKIIERKNFSRRPKVANLTSLICVIATKLPKPDLLMLDKQLVFTEYLSSTAWRSSSSQRTVRSFASPAGTSAMISSAAARNSGKFRFWAVSRVKWARLYTKLSFERASQTLVGRRMGNPSDAPPASPS